MKQIDIKEINDMVFTGWQGDVDPQALRERISEMLLAEKTLIKLQSRVSSFVNFIRDYGHF